MNQWKKQRTRIIGNQRIVILLSTYNAEKYLREQLDSILKQTRTDWQLIVRDDGSRDGTLAILEEYTKKYNTISYYAGDNLGAKNSFFDLMKRVENQDFDYVAFCDQDDYWLPDKLKRATKVLDLFSGQKKADVLGQAHTVKSFPLLYCGKPQLVDKELSPILKEIKRTIRPGFSNALVENIVTGCTTVLNRAMYDIVMQLLPEYCIMHDWWMYLAASCFGQVLYDETPMIYYRQHENNVMGIDGSRTAELKHRASKYKSRRSNISMQAGELLALWKKLEHQKKQEQGTYRFLESNWERKQYLPEKAEGNDWMIRVSRREPVAVSRRRADTLANCKKLGNRLRLAFGKVIYRQRKMDDLIFRILFLLGLR